MLKHYLVEILRIWPRIEAECWTLKFIFHKGTTVIYRFSTVVSTGYYWQRTIRLLLNGLTC